jgi:DNA primase
MLGGSKTATVTARRSRSWPMRTFSDMVEAHLDVRSRSGDEWAALCPFHSDSQPSFWVNVEKLVYVCYACGAKGNAKMLARHLGLELGEETADESLDRLRRTLMAWGSEPAALETIPSKWIALWQLSADTRARWAERGITDDGVFKDFQLGYDSTQDQLVIPVHDPVTGDLVSFIRRNLSGDGPKYVYRTGFKISQQLYGSYQARVANSRVVAIVEGSIDALCMWQAGIPAVALLGARVSPTQATLLQRLDPMAYVLMTDADRAGRAAAQDIRQRLAGTGIIVREPVNWPEGCKDPGDMSERQRTETFESAR